MSKASQFFGLSIDKLSITCNDVHPSHVKNTCIQLGDTAKQGFPGFHLKSGQRHFLHGTLKINGSSPPLVIQAGPRHSGISDYRFEMNPAKLGPEGMAQIKTFIDAHFGCGANYLFSNGNITRIDIALDLPGLALDDVVARSAGSRIHGLYTGQTGEIETTYLGGTKSSRTAIYTKVSEDREKFLRLERRMKPRSGIRGNDLQEMANPFDRVSLVSIRSLTAHLNDINPEHFHDSIRMRGLTHVLAKLPDIQRRRLKQVFLDPANSLLPAIETIWAGWPDLLRRSGLGPLCLAGKY